MELFSSTDHGPKVGVARSVVFDGGAFLKQLDQFGCVVCIDE